MKKFIILALCVVGVIVGMVYQYNEKVDKTYTFVVPQKPGSGTSTWAQIVVEQLGPFLEENIVIKHIPGARDIPGFNEFHNNLRSDDNVIMVSHGGNGVSFLQENVDYDYNEYDSVGLMNLNIIAGKLKGADMENPKFSGGSGTVPEAFAMAMLICGPMTDYVDCFKEHVTWVPGMSSSERRLAFKRGELTGTRENPAAYKKHVEPNPDAELWFHHGILQPDGSHIEDQNYPGFFFEDLYFAKWGVKPSGDFYDAYQLVVSFRDGMQKALWVNKGNPNLTELREALRKMSQDPEATKAIQKKVGNYEWLIGEKGNKHRDILMSFVNEKALTTLIDFNTNALGLNSVYKPELLK